MTTEHILWSVCALLAGFVLNHVFGSLLRVQQNKAEKYETIVTSQLSSNQKDISKSLEKCWEKVDKHGDRLTVLETEHKANHCSGLPS